MSLSALTNMPPVAKPKVSAPVRSVMCMIVLLKLLNTWTIAHLSPVGGGVVTGVGTGVAFGLGVGDVVSLLNFVSSCDLVHHHLPAEWVVLVAERADVCKVDGLLVVYQDVVARDPDLLTGDADMAV